MDEGAEVRRHDEVRPRRVREGEACVLPGDPRLEQLAVQAGDGNAAACWGAMSPIATLIKAHPLPLNLKAASDLEAARLLAIAMNQVCANPNCGQMFLDVNNSIAAITPLPLPISMTSICAKIPVIGTSAVPTAGTVAPIQGTSTPTAPAAAPVAPH